jgi:hypothetical protein
MLNRLSSMLAAMPDLGSQFDELMVRRSIDGLPKKTALQLVATLVNLSVDLKRSDGTMTRGAAFAHNFKLGGRRAAAGPSIPDCPAQ